MEGPITKHFYFVDPLKQKELIIEFMNLNNFDHPIIQPFLDELKISQKDLQKPLSVDFTDRRVSSDLSEQRFYHQEARRLAKIEVLAELIQSRGIFPTNPSTNSKKNLLSSPQKNNKSYKSILTSEPDVPLTIPLDQTMISERQIISQKKKLERLLKVSDNIKHIQLEKEKRRFEIVKELEEKNQKIKQGLMVMEEERSKRNQELEVKRRTKLKQKYDVRDMQEIDSKELKAIEEHKITKQSRHDRSKTSLHMRSTYNNE